MIKREIKKFERSINDSSPLSCEAPASVCSVLKEYDQEYERAVGRVDFAAEVFADEAALAAKHSYLRIRDVRQPARLYINDELIGDIDGNSPSHTFSIKDKFARGSNTVLIRFNSDECKHYGTIGVFKAPEILRFSNAVIDRVHVDQTHADGVVTVGIKLDILGSSENVRAVATLTSPTGQIYYAGLTKCEGSIKVTDPLYWMPRGLGVQNLYKLTVNLYGEEDVEDSMEMKIGLRTIKKADEDGRALLVNGTRLLPMGATYRADDLPDTSAYPAKEEAYVGFAAKANYNTLLLPVGAPRPNERFFELCDAYGIIVIEETDTLECGMLDAIETRATHPSYALLEVVSPSGNEYIAPSLATVVPELDFTILTESTRFISAPSLPSDKTLSKVVPQDERNLFSRAVESIAEDGAIGEMMLAVSERYPYPATLSDFAYASALAAANKVGEVIKESRMTRGRSGRAIFDRLGDSVPSISPSAMDSSARWKPLQYLASHYFSPVALYAEHTDGGVLFSVSNERKIDFIGNIEYRLATSKNVTLYQGSEACEVSAMTSRELFTRDFKEHMRLFEDSCYIEYYLKEGSSVISHGTLLTQPEKHFHFVDPDIKFSITGSNRNFSITLIASAFAKSVEIDFVDMDAVLSDNYFDITSDSPIKINVELSEGPQSVFHLENSLQIRSVYDLKL